MLDKKSCEILKEKPCQEIVKLLQKRPYTLEELAKIMNGNIEKHLVGLRKCSIIVKNRTGDKWTYYELTEKGRSAFEPKHHAWVAVFVISVIGISFGIFTLINGSYFADLSKAYNASERQSILTHGDPAVKDLLKNTELREPSEPIVYTPDLPVLAAIMILWIALLAFSAAKIMERKSVLISE